MALLARRLRLERPRGARRAEAVAVPAGGVGAGRAVDGDGEDGSRMKRISTYFMDGERRGSLGTDEDVQELDCRVGDL